TRSSSLRPSHIVRGVPLALFLLVTMTSALEPAREADPGRIAAPAVRLVGDRDGLPQNTVKAIAFDRDGFLWVGTQDGAAVSDGRTGTTVDMPARRVCNWISTSR